MAEQMDKELRGAYERLVMHMYFHQVLGVEIPDEIKARWSQTETVKESCKKEEE